MLSDARGSTNFLDCGQRHSGGVQVLERILSWFRRPTAEIEIETTGGSLRPGGTIDVQITIRPKSVVKVNSGQLELTCTEQSWHKESPTETGQGMLETRNALSQPLIQSFMADTELTDSDPVVRYARFQIPKEAPPTVHGSIAQVSWEVKGRLALESGAQVTRSQEIKVLTPPAINPGRSAADLTEEATFSECILAMVLVNDVVGSGGYMEGELRAQMNVAEQAKEIRVELHTIETSGDREYESVSGLVSLETDVQLTVGRPYVWAFSLPVPDMTLPTVQSGRTSVSWRIKAVVDTNQEDKAYHLERVVQIFTSTVQA